MPFTIVRNDITKMKVDAIVNAANAELKQGGGVCGAIFEAAGVQQLSEACERIGHCEPGQAVITDGFALPAKHIIHTVGPVWEGGQKYEAQILAQCYFSSMELARQNHLKSIAFPLISSGIYGYPKDLALEVAISAIGGYILKHDLMVYLVVYDVKAFVVSTKVFVSVEKFIDDHYVEEHGKIFLNRYDNMPSLPENVQYSSLERTVETQRIEPREHHDLEEFFAHQDSPFSEHLFHLIDRKRMRDTDVYHRANIDRRLFSRIRSDRNYNPSKATALALAIALRLNLDETQDLLRRAGYTLSNSSKMDLIIRYHIEEGKYDIMEINQVLFKFDQPLLGSC
jgi:O-acetyl-ADP-ribose deacetylase (regulator of RNase III)